MKFDKNIIANCFVTGFLFIICSIAMMIVPEDSYINDFSILQSDWSILDLVIGESVIGDAGVDTGSVTEQITEKNKQKLFNMTYNAIDSIRPGVNGLDPFRFFDVHTLYLIPIGKSNCFSNFESPLSKSFDYFYVGVTYTGKNYLYYVTAFDSSGVGIRFVSERDLSSGTWDSHFDNETELPALKEIYMNNDENTSYYEEGNRYALPLSTIEGYQKLLNVSERKYIEIISSCKR